MVSHWLVFLLSLPVICSLETPLSEFNLQRRPLNAYVTANAVHVKSTNRSITIDKTTIPYTEAFPPFLIHNRGTVLLLSKDPSLLFSGRPSLFQMITATGHRTIVPYVIPKKITDFIKKAELHHTILISFPTIKSDFPSQLEGVVLIDPTEDSDLPPPTIPTVLLYTDNNTADQGQGEEWNNTRIESIRYSTHSLSDPVKAREKFGQILANFFDLVHLR